MENIYKTIDGKLFKKLLAYGYKGLVEDYHLINDLNVFPVPDGDTGTNMKLTFESGLSAIKSEERICDVASEFARGCLFGARGNSGVLLSQYFKGVAQSLEGKTFATVKDTADAMVSGYKMAYKSAVNPVEGTFLTVAREGVDSILPQITNDMDHNKYLSLLYESSKKSLENTPNLLEVLRENGVIDSGGQGLLSIFKGMIWMMNGKEMDDLEISHGHTETQTQLDLSLFNENSTLDYGYCTEFLLQLLNSKCDVNKFNVDKFIEDISKFGDSLIVTQSGSIVKVHIHTKTPYVAIEYAQGYGEFLTFKMENMTLQHNNVVKVSKRKNIGIITIGYGDGIINLLKDAGASIVLNGGQTMNTSVTELLDAFDRVNADNIILLPNNKNILLAAKAAIEMYDKSKVYLVETKTIQEGYFGLSMSVLTEQDPEVLFNTIKENSKLIIPCLVAKTTKDALMDGVRTLKGEYIEYVDETVVGSKLMRKDAVLEMIDKIENIEDKEMMFIIYGQDVSLEEVEDIKASLEDKYPYLEIGILEGKQDVKDYLIGVNLWEKSSLTH